MKSLIVAMIIAQVDPTTTALDQLKARQAEVTKKFEAELESCKMTEYYKTMAESRLGNQLMSIWAEAFAGKEVNINEKVKAIAKIDKKLETECPNLIQLEKDLFHYIDRIYEIEEKNNKEKGGA